MVGFEWATSPHSCWDYKPPSSCLNKVEKSAGDKIDGQNYQNTNKMWPPPTTMETHLKYQVGSFLPWSNQFDHSSSLFIIAHNSFWSFHPGFLHPATGVIMHPLRKETFEKTHWRKVEKRSLCLIAHNSFWSINSGDQLCPFNSLDPETTSLSRYIASVIQLQPIIGGNVCIWMTDLRCLGEIHTLLLNYWTDFPCSHCANIQLLMKHSKRQQFHREC